MVASLQGVDNDLATERTRCSEHDEVAHLLTAAQTVTKPARSSHERTPWKNSQRLRVRFQSAGVIRVPPAGREIDRDVEGEGPPPASGSAARGCRAGTMPCARGRRDTRPRRSFCPVAPTPAPAGTAARRRNAQRPAAHGPRPRGCSAVMCARQVAVVVGDERALQEDVCRHVRLCVRVRRREAPVGQARNAVTGSSRLQVQPLVPHRERLEDCLDRLPVRNCQWDACGDEAAELLGGTAHVRGIRPASSAGRGQAMPRASPRPATASVPTAS